MGQAVGGRGHEGLEGELGVELDGGGLLSHLAPARRGSPWGSAACRAGGRGGRRGPGRSAAGRLLDLEAAPDGASHLVGQGVLNHGQVARFDPLPDQPVGDRQGEHAVGEGHRLDPRQPELPRALRDLVTQGFGASRPEICRLRHGFAARPFSPLGIQPLLGTILGTGNWTNVHRPADATRAGLQIAPNMGGLAAAGRTPLEGRGMTLRRTGPVPSGRRERLNRREAHLPTQHPEAGPHPRVPQAHVHPCRAGHLEVAAAQGTPPSQRLRPSCLPGRSDASPAARPSPSCNAPVRAGRADPSVPPSSRSSRRPRCVPPGGLRNWASLRRRGGAEPPPAPGPRRGASRGRDPGPRLLPGPTRSRRRPSTVPSSERTWPGPCSEPGGRR